MLRSWGSGMVTEEDLFQCIGATWKWMAMGMVVDMGTYSGCRLRRQQAVVAELFRTENQRRRRSDTLTQRQRTGAVGGHILGFPQFPRLPRKWKLRLSNCCVLARNSEFGAKSIAIKFGLGKQLSTYVKWFAGVLGGNVCVARPMLLF